MKPKHIILFPIVIIAIALSILFAFALKKHNYELNKIELLPDISLTTIDGEEFSLTASRSERKTAILFFSTDCEFCRKEIKGIIAAKETFLGIDWVFVTISSKEDVDAFLIECPLDIIDGAKVCIEESPDFLFALNITSPPSLFIYDVNGRLENYSRGAISIQTILEWLK